MMKIDPGTSSLITQILAMGLAAVIGARYLRSRLLIALTSLAGGLIAMGVNLMVDGQGAFMVLIYCPIIYWIAVAGRHDLDAEAAQRGFDVMPSEKQNES